MSTNHKRKKVQPDTIIYVKGRPFLRIDEERMLSFTPISFEFVDIRLRTQAYRNTPDSRFPDERPPERRPAPAGCPTCAKVTSLMPEISVETGRVN